MSNKLQLEAHSSFSDFLNNSHPFTTSAAVVTITDEKYFSVYKTVSSDAQNGSVVQSLEAILPNDEPYFIFVRAETDPSKLHLVSFVPDEANVRRKMLFASSRSAILDIVTLERVQKTLFATSKEDLKQLSSDSSSPVPAISERISTAKEEIIQHRPNSHAPRGVHLALSKDASDTLSQLKNDPEHTLIVLSITNEVIQMVEKSQIPPSQLKSHFSESEPRYAFYTIAAPGGNKIVFVYVCPMTSTVKNRMLYSSSRAGILDSVKEFFPVDGKIEYGSVNDIDENDLKTSVGLEKPASQQTSKMAFHRPRPPRRR
ncbi:twinfilin [Schizosaccharomyces japonicus yFS275]|uniref:Twinfilin n=1 Tax=Schizosaccharomyces japonicus (strain yFS275 / FY16936) TaxID=402676 RepID=B6JZF5_SCHJY|nr:twinfilin [Schizosaccharomyces japonicus yFS275]EEB06923.1 twinfilin [Schizosaccharomyces japonicus yFS275]